MPVAFGRLGGAQNHAPVHFLKSQDAQARGLEHPESFRARQARNKNRPGDNFELLVRGLGAFSIHRKTAVQGPGEEKCEHSSHET